MQETHTQADKFNTQHFADMHTQARHDSNLPKRFLDGTSRDQRRDERYPGDGMEAGEATSSRVSVLPLGYPLVVGPELNHIKWSE